MATAQQEGISRPSESRPHVLHFLTKVCWPLDTGAKLRNYHLAREVAKGARISMLAFTDDPGRTENDRPTRVADEQQTSGSDNAAGARPTAPQPSVLPKPVHFYERLLTVRRDRGYTLPKIIRGAFGSTPLPMLNYTTAEMRRELARTLEEQEFDLVQIESIHLAAYLPIIRAARKRPLVICDWHNIESNLMQRYSEHTPDPLRRVYARRTSQQLAAVEQRVMREFDAHVVVSTEERDKLLERAPEARVYLIENGVDTEYYSDERIRGAHSNWLGQQQYSTVPAKAHDDLQSESAQPGRALFVGSMDYHANIEAVTYFAREVWPRLRDRHPQLIFTIVGRDPTPEVRRLSDLPGIEVTGTVDDVRPYYYDALLAVIPLRVGGGSRLKILEAMAAGVPVVSTRLGAEGIEVEDGANIVLADTSDQLQSAISDLVINGERRRELAVGGRALVFARYDWSRLGASLVDLHRELLSQRESPSVADPNH